MEDKLKLAEIKGYVEGCLNKFSGIPTTGPDSYFFKDLNAILDIVMDKQSQQSESEELEFFNKQWQAENARLNLKNQKYQQEIAELKNCNMTLSEGGNLND